jgi:hypothetical protein
MEINLKKILHVSGFVIFGGEIFEFVGVNFF